MSRLTPTAQDWEMLGQWLVLGFVPFTFLAAVTLGALGISMIWAPVAGPVACPAV